MHPTSCSPPRARLLRVISEDGLRRAFAVTEAEGLQLIRLGLAHTFGTKRRVHGLRLTVDIATAAAQLAGNPHLDRAPAGGLRTVYRETVGGGHHLWSHRSACAARSTAA